MSQLAGLLLGLLTLLYPVAVYFGLGRVSPQVFALVLAALWTARAWFAGRHVHLLLLSLGVLLYSLYLALAGTPHTLRWYPVLVSTVLLVVFGFSLWRGPSLIERLARLREPALPPRAVHYTRQVTKVWCVFLLVNGSVAAATAAWAPWSVWTLYNGLISYVLMGTLFAVEWLVRQRVRRAA